MTDTDPRVITRKCHQPSPRERINDWLRRHPDAETMFAQHLFAPTEITPENPYGTQPQSKYRRAERSS
jgi:hypothetical protein